MIEHLHDAIFSAADDRAFRYVPVDWWDANALVWRPAIYEGSGTLGRTHQSEAVIVVPTKGQGEARTTCTTKMVDLHDLRLTTNFVESAVRCGNLRYTLELMELLAPCFRMAPVEERERFEQIVDSVISDFQLALGAWMFDFSAGFPHVTLDEMEERHLMGSQVVKGNMPMFPPMLDSMTDGALIDLMAPERGYSDEPMVWSPVALWDAEDQLWRPTLVLGQVERDEQLLPSWESVVLVPSTPLSVRRVSGADLRVYDMQGWGMSLYALPVIAHDIARMHDALSSLGWVGDQESHPVVDSLQTMLEGAQEEWMEFFDAGVPGDPPTPRVAILPVSMWGFTADTSLEEVETPSFDAGFPSSSLWYGWTE